MKALLTAIIITLLAFVACSPGPETSINTPPESTIPVPTTTPIPTTTPTLKRISLDDAPSILNISFLLPSRFEEIDPASEGMSNKDMGLGPDCSEVQLYMSEDPFQMVWGIIGIGSGRIEGVTFDRQIEEGATIVNLIKETIENKAREEGYEATIPNMNVTHPEIGDSAILGEGSMETYGFYYGFDTLWFRSNKVYVFLYSVSMSSDKVYLLPIAKEIEKRVGSFSQ